MTAVSLGELLFKIAIRFEPDIVTSRQKTKMITAELGFDSQDQIRFATAVSELARNVFQYAKTGTLEYYFSSERPQFFYIVVSDSGPGILAINKILEGTYSSTSGMGLGLMGAKKLMDYFDVKTSPNGTKVTIGKKLRLFVSEEKTENLKEIITALVCTPASNPFELLQNQNRELSMALEEVRLAKQELSKLYQELAETNRAVVVLYEELDGRALSLKSANEALVAATEQAELANLAKSRFLSNMSHEIRTPLGIIQGFSELALNPHLSNTEREGFLNTVRRNAANLTKLIGEVLDLSKVEAGVVELENTYFSLRELISEVLTGFELQASHKNVRLSFSFHDNCPWFVISDQMRLRQILINVIGNALKFTAAGEVTLVVSAQATDKELSNEPESSMIQFLIKDTGIGLSPENQLKLFQPFVQADSSTTRKFGGTGLGLSLSKKLAQALGGDLVLVESRLDVGSTFSLIIKNDALLAAGQEPIFLEDSETPVAPEKVLTGLHVLLVEDSDDNQLLFSTYLTQAGANVDIGADGIFGVALALKKSYDVILMDVQMPNLDGFSATAQLRAAGIKAPIVALTSHAMKEDRDRALASGFTHYLTKPLESKLLVQTLLPLKKNITVPTTYFSSQT